MFAYLDLLISLLVILVAAEVFTNALEHLGQRLGISEGMTGSVFAAVGTALPETTVPLLAVFAGTANVRVNHEIGVGAILGAPLMLSTLSLSLLALTTLRRRGIHGAFRPEPSGLTRDLNFFLMVFSVAGAALFVPPQAAALRVSIAIILVTSYFVYLLLTLRASSALVERGHATEAHAPVLLARIGLPENLAVILAQLALGLGLLVGGAKGFIYGVERISEALGISALLLSLVIVPIATELPEKVNSVLWVRRGKDTLAFGNITGAMVFQGSLLTALGITLTPWVPQREVLGAVGIALLAGLWLRWRVGRGDLRVWHLLVNGALYIAYIVLAFWMRTPGAG
ncbi:MAG: sodium:proton exchanger [Chromatiales bacterium 21-64-14]|nr:MAG: sodium:proton exchanger [Chromatiales bacterium 21-64-14]HQU16911.1 sodium:calcium antiporter [Gammaproteobacteria bacterium]